MEVQGTICDDHMEEVRQKLDWETQYAVALDPGKTCCIRESRAPEEGTKNPAACMVSSVLCGASIKP